MHAVGEKKKKINAEKNCFFVLSTITQLYLHFLSIGITIWWSNLALWNIHSNACQMVPYQNTRLHWSVMLKTCSIKCFHLVLYSTYKFSASHRPPPPPPPPDRKLVFQQNLCSSWHTREAHCSISIIKSGKKMTHFNSSYAHMWTGNSIIWKQKQTKRPESIHQQNKSKGVSYEKKGCTNNMQCLPCLCVGAGLSPSASKIEIIPLPSWWLTDVFEAQERKKKKKKKLRHCTPWTEKWVAEGVETNMPQNIYNPQRCALRPWQKRGQ